MKMLLAIVVGLAMWAFLGGIITVAVFKLFVPRDE